MTRRLISDPSLKGVSVVVLDEFHERHLEGDLALALLKRLQDLVVDGVADAGRTGRRRRAWLGSGKR